MIAIPRSDMEALLELHDDIGEMQERIERHEAPVLVGRKSVSVMDLHLDQDALWELGVMCIAAALLQGKDIPRRGFGCSEQVRAVLVKKEIQK